MNCNLHELVFLLDQSSKISDLYGEAQKGFKNLLESQKKCQTDTNVTLCVFGSDYANIADNIPISKVKMGNEPFELSGTCPFVDSAVRVIDEVGARLSKTPEYDRPSKVIVILVNFDRDNASKSYTYDQLAEKIKHQTEVYKWSFYLLTDFSINMEKLGIPEENTFIVKLSEKNSFTDEYRNLSGSISELRQETAE